MTSKKATSVDILKNKASSVHYVHAQSTVSAAVKEMNRLRIGSVMVKRGDAVVGIFTERDILVRVVAEGRDAESTSIEEVMTQDFQSITAETTVEDTMHLMTEKRVRHLPVFQDDSLVGMISIGDVTRWLLEANEIEAENLRRYAFSEYPG